MPARQNLNPGVRKHIEKDGFGHLRGVFGQSLEFPSHEHGHNRRLAQFGQHCLREIAPQP